MMDIERLREYCLAKPGTTESFPFDEFVLVFKVKGKMFAASNIGHDELVLGLKCDPEKALELREEFDEISPGFHMNKKHWNSVKCEGGLSDIFICDLINHSYELVVKGLRKSDRDEIMTEEK